MPMFDMKVNEIPDKEKKHGFINSIHHFGTSVLVRKSSNYFLVWQYRKSKSLHATKLTHKQYQELKKCLGPEHVRKEVRHETLKVIHVHKPKHYMRVLRYLNKEELL